MFDARSSRGPLTALTLLLAATALAGCHTPATHAGELVIGSLNVLSGPAAGLGLTGRQGIDLAVDEINDAGGIDGKRVRVVHGDDKLDPVEGTKVFDQMVADGSVQAIVGSLSSTITKALIPRAEENKVVLISPASTSVDLTHPRLSTYFFRDIPANDIQGETAASLLFDELEMDSTVVMYQNNQYSSGLKDVFVPAYTALGGTIDGEPIQFHASDNTLYAGQAQLAVSLGPEHVWISGQSPESAYMIKELRNAGYDGPILTSEAVEDSAIFPIAGEALNGVLFTRVRVDETSPEFQDFKAAFRAKHGHDPGVYSHLAYDALHIVAEAIEAAGNDGTAIRDHIQATTFRGRVTNDAIAFNQFGDVTEGEYVLWEISFEGGEGSFKPRAA